MTLVTFQIPTFAALMGVWACRVLERNLVKLEANWLSSDQCFIFLFHSIALQKKEKNSNRTKRQKTTRKIAHEEDLLRYSFLKKSWQINLTLSFSTESKIIESSVTIMCRNDELSWLFTKRFRVFFYLICRK